MQILQGEIIADDPNSNNRHLLKLNNDLYLYDNLLTKDAKQIGLF
jgi:hypothetical protein